MQVKITADFVGHEKEMSVIVCFIVNYMLRFTHRF